MKRGSPGQKRTIDAATLRELKAAAKRSDKLQKALDGIAELTARQGDELTTIRKLLRRREAQLMRAEREIRKLRRRLGLDDPDPEPNAEAVPTDDPDAPEAPPAGDASGEDGPPAPDAPDEPESGDAGGGPSPKRRGGGGGRRPPPKHLPKDEEHHPVHVCAHCGHRLLQRDVRKTDIYSVVKSYVRCRRIHRGVGECTNPDCGCTTAAPMPPMPYKRALYDCGFLAWLVMMKFAYMMPLDRIRAMLASQGVNIAMGTLVRLIEQATKLAETVDGEHMKQLRSGTHMCFDGTGLKVLIRGQDKAWDGYLEVFAREDLTVFQFDLTKHADALRDRLANVTAVLVTDAESRNKAGAAPDAVFANCNAHVVRSLEAAAQVQPVLAKEGLSFLQELYALEDEAKRLGLTKGALWRHRQKGLPVLKRFKRWLREVAEGDLPPSDPVRKVAKYYLKHWDALTRFIDDPALPIDNNTAEREFQRHAKLRLASLFAGSVEGAHRWAVLLGVVRTAQKHQLDVQAYLTWLFERRGSHRKRFNLSARELTPAAYKAAGCPGSLMSADRAA